MVLNETLIKPNPLYDQLAEGLRTLDVLTYVRAYPRTMEPLFVPTEAITSIRVKEMLVKPSSLTSHEEELWSFLEEFLNDCSADGKV